MDPSAARAAAKMRGHRGTLPPPYERLDHRAGPGSRAPERPSRRPGNARRLRSRRHDSTRPGERGSAPATLRRSHRPGDRRDLSARARQLDGPLAEAPRVLRARQSALRPRDRPSRSRIGTMGFTPLRASFFASRAAFLPREPWSNLPNSPSIQAASPVPVAQASSRGRSNSRSSWPCSRASAAVAHSTLSAVLVASISPINAYSGMAASSHSGCV